MGLVVKRRDLYGSLTVSAVTSETYYVGDAERYSIYIDANGSTSTFTIQGASVDGRSAAIAEADWLSLFTFASSTTTYIDSSIHNLPYVRWLRAQRRGSAATPGAILSLRERYT